MGILVIEKPDELRLARYRLQIDPSGNVDLQAAYGLVACLQKGELLQISEFLRKVDCYNTMTETERRKARIK